MLTNPSFKLKTFIRSNSLLHPNCTQVILTRILCLFKLDQSDTVKINLVCRKSFEEERECNVYYAELTNLKKKYDCSNCHGHFGVE